MIFTYLPLFVDCRLSFAVQHPVYDPLSLTVYLLAYAGRTGTDTNPVVFMCADARTGAPCAGFGAAGVVDLSSYFSAPVDEVFGGATLVHTQGAGTLQAAFTVSSYPDRQGVDPVGTVLRLDPSNGKLIESYVLPRSAAEVEMLASAPLRITCTEGSSGKSTQLLLAPRLDGSVYVFAAEAVAAGPVAVWTPQITDSSGLPVDISISTPYPAITAQGSLLLGGWHGYTKQYVVIALLSVCSPRVVPSGGGAAAGQPSSSPALAASLSVLALSAAGAVVWFKRRIIFSQYTKQTIQQHVSRVVGYVKGSKAAVAFRTSSSLSYSSEEEAERTTILEKSHPAF